MKRALSENSLPIFERAGWRSRAAAGIFFLMVAGLAAVPCAASAGNQTKKQEPGAPAPMADRELASRLVEATLAGYRNYTRGVFMDAVSEEYVTDRNRFVGGVEKSFYSARPLSVDFFLDQVTQNAEFLSTSFTWNKKVMVRTSGQQAKSRGHCLFVYKKSDDGWNLYSVKGESPF